MDSVGAGGRLGANDGMKGSRSEDTFKSLILPKIDIFRPRSLVLRNEIESGRICCIEAHGDIYRVYKGNPRLDLMTILPLTS